MTDTFSQTNLYDYFYWLVQQIPRGRVSTYKLMACALGDCNVARAVGWLLKENPNPITIPCHRVVMSDGAPGGYAGPYVERKIELLQEEGIEFRNGKVNDFQNILFNDFDTSYPLEELRKEQKQIGMSVKIPEDMNDEYSSILGLDVSYRDRTARGAAVLLENGQVRDSIVIEDKINFPYISTYLAFRELPLYLSLLCQLEKRNLLPDVILVDGNGILHPRRCGIGVHLHYETGLPVIGVAKSRLCGEIGEYRELERSEGMRSGKDAIFSEVYYGDELLGYAYIYDTTRIKNPVFVSPGGGISLADSLRIVANLSQYRIPEPIRHAHYLAIQWE